MSVPDIFTLSPAECDVYTCTPVYTWTPFVSDANYYLKSFLRSCPAFSAISRGNDYNGKKRNPRSHNIRLDEINLNFIHGWQLCWFCLLKDSILESDAFLPALQRCWHVNLIISDYFFFFNSCEWKDNLSDCSLQNEDWEIKAELISSGRYTRNDPKEIDWSTCLQTAVKFTFVFNYDWLLIYFVTLFLFSQRYGLNLLARIRKHQKIQRIIGP